MYYCAALLQTKYQIQDQYIHCRGKYFGSLGTKSYSNHDRYLEPNKKQQNIHFFSSSFFLFKSITKRSKICNNIYYTFKINVAKLINSKKKSMSSFIILSICDCNVFEKKPVNITKISKRNTDSECPIRQNNRNS